jgi:hypothetical protein
MRSCSYTGHNGSCCERRIKRRGVPPLRVPALPESDAEEKAGTLRSEDRAGWLRKRIIKISDSVNPPFAENKSAKGRPPRKVF